jgi:hypothetical protein
MKMMKEVQKKLAILKKHLLMGLQHLQHLLKELMMQQNKFLVIY